ncbi:MAG TPA: hypothetical protein VGK21_08985, partial [Candidatus Angelobacter sp.]
RYWYFKSNRFLQFVSAVKSTTWRLVHRGLPRIGAADYESPISMRVQRDFCDFCECENVRKNQW